MTLKVGAVVRMGPATEGAPPPSYAAIREMALHMESAGIDSIWLYDHLIYRYPNRPSDGIWEGWTMLSALAEATRRVELGTLVACTPFRNPALLAKMAVTLDEVSAGRITLGVGAGWHEPEFQAFGFPFDHRVSRLDEALQIMRPLLHDGQVDFDGTYYTARDCEILPRGPRPSGPPLMVAGKGPRMLQLVARYADAWNTAWHRTPDTAQPAIEKMRAVCRAEGRDPATLAITASVAIAYPDLGAIESRRNYLIGSDAEIAQAFRGYDAMGVSHVMVEFTPYLPEAVDRLAAAIQQFRG